MAEDLYRVEVTVSSLEQVYAREAPTTKVDATFSFDVRLAKLRAIVIPKLARFPRSGRRYLTNPPQSAEALAQLARLLAGAASALGEYLHGDYLMLFTVKDAKATVYPLSIWHHPRLSIDIARLRPKGN